MKTTLRTLLLLINILILLTFIPTCAKKLDINDDNNNSLHNVDTIHTIDDKDKNKDKDNIKVYRIYPYNEIILLSINSIGVRQDTQSLYLAGSVTKIKSFSLSLFCKASLLTPAETISNT